MAEDNKMWEGHRIIYPNLREKYLESKKEPFARPCWDEQKLEYLENLVCYAITTSSLIKLTIWHKNGPQEKEIIPIRQSGRTLECQNKMGKTLFILLADILDIVI